MAFVNLELHVLLTTGLPDPYKVMLMPFNQIVFFGHACSSHFNRALHSQFDDVVTYLIKKNETGRNSNSM